MRNPRKAFTLIELLVVILIIGVLAMIVLPKFTRQRENAHVAAMKSDLRNLVAAQEALKTDSTSYASSHSMLPSYRPTTGVVITINEGTKDGWSATSSHSATTRTCTIHIGTGVTSSGGSEGEPVCS